MTFGRQVRAAWQTFARRAGRYQTEILLNVIYVLVLGPSTLAGRLFGNRLLDLGERPAPSYFVKRPAPDTSLTGQLRQF